MNTFPPAGTEPVHSPDDAVRWFQQWAIYRSIVDADWMNHRGIFGAVRTWVLVHHPGPFTLLDLGCGDAGLIRKTFADTGLWAYTAVDASATALAEARKELAGAPFAVRLLEEDLLAFLRGGPGDREGRFNIILTSYAVHHLPTREKGKLFRPARERLAPGGDPSPHSEPGLVRESSCPDWGWKGFSDEEATQCRADRGLASAG